MVGEWLAPATKEPATKSKRNVAVVRQQKHSTETFKGYASTSFSLFSKKFATCSTLRLCFWSSDVQIMLEILNI